MTEQAALLAAILAQPDDDTVRLAYADWLDEHGQDARAEFIRVQVELSRMVDEKMALDGMRAMPVTHDLSQATFMGQAISDEFRASIGRCTAFRLREWELWSAHRYSWVDGFLGDGWKTCGLDQIEFENTVRVEFTCRGTRTSPMELVPRRGFIESVTCTATDWFIHADSIRAQHPIRSVTLTTWFVSFNGRAILCDQWGSALARRFPGIRFELPPDPELRPRVLRDVAHAAPT